LDELLKNLRNKVPDVSQLSYGTFRESLAKILNITDLSQYRELIKAHISKVGATSTDEVEETKDTGEVISIQNNSYINLTFN
jgi:hypothetical protein